MPERLLPAVGVTATAVVFPAALAVALRDSGLIASLPALVLVAATASLATSSLAARAWRRRDGSGDVLFADLMLWNWLRRQRQERSLKSAAALLGGDREARAAVLERLSHELEARDPSTHGHSRRVARHATRIARRLGLPRERVATVRLAALLHDIGKVETPRELLERPGSLSADELEVVRRHADVGAAMTAGLGNPELTAIVRHHHERLDGGGYPEGLSGERIPLGARIVAVADTFDAVTSERPYRARLSHGEALALLEREAGSQLDPQAVRAFRGGYAGLRQAAVGATVLSLPRPALAILFEQLRFGSLLGGAKLAAASLATVAVGAATLAPKGPVGEASQEPLAAASSTAPTLTGEAAAMPLAAPPGADAPAREQPSTESEQRPRAPEHGIAPPLPPVTRAAQAPSATAEPSSTEAAPPPSEGAPPPGAEGESGASTPVPTSSAEPTGAPTTPVEAPAEPAEQPPSLAASVGQTIDAVSALPGQATGAPLLEEVGSAVQQVTGGLLGRRQ